MYRKETQKTGIKIMTATCRPAKFMQLIIKTKTKTKNIQERKQFLLIPEKFKTENVLHLHHRKTKTEDLTPLAAPTASQNLRTT